MDVFDLTEGTGSFFCAVVLLCATGKQPVWAQMPCVQLFSESRRAAETTQVI